MYPSLVPLIFFSIAAAFTPGPNNILGSYSGFNFGGSLGIKKSSAQITHYYNEQNLVGKQVIGVCNFPKKNIAGIISEVLILGAIEKDGKVVLVHPSQKVENGLEIA